MKKQHLLDLLVSRFPEYSREELSAFIACRNVTVCGEICGDPKQFFPPDIHISLSFEPYVSRGGVKLEHALHVFPVSVKDLVMLDAGSSTGGFTDCLCNTALLASMRWMSEPTNWIGVSVPIPGSLSMSGGIS